MSIAPGSWDRVAVGGSLHDGPLAISSHLLTGTVAVNSSNRPVRVPVQSGWKAPGVVASA